MSQGRVLADDGGLVMSNEAVTTANFFAGRHFSVPDHMEQALVRWAEDGVKAERIPVAATEAMIREAEARLAVRLPNPFRRLYALLDGGVVGYPFHAGLGTDEREAPRSPFAGAYAVGTLLPLSAWVSLAQLSSRLSFPAATPYAQLYESPECLVVISASFDTALLLDYRGSCEPIVLHCPDLMRPETCVSLGPAETFLAALRQRAHPLLNDSLPIGDPRLAPRVASADTFWLPDAQSAGAADEAFARFAERFGAEVPHGFVPLLKKQNGGRARFRFAPPLAHSRNPLDAPRSDPRSAEWVDVFPGGIWPVDNWVDFSEFRRLRDVARDQDPREGLMHETHTEPDVTECLIVIGADGHAALTLLDLSAGFFKKSSALSRADYMADTDRYCLAVMPITIRHYSHGVFRSLRARIDEIE